MYILLDIERLPDGVFLATSKNVQGLVAQGKTLEETIEIAEDLAKKLLKAQKKQIKSSRTIHYPMLVSV